MTVPARTSVSILPLLCDSGERCLPNDHEAQWVDRTIGDCTEARRRMKAWLHRSPDRCLA